MALRATIFMSLIGKEGFVKLSNQNYSNANYLKGEISKIDGIEIYNQNPIFNEFVVSFSMNSDEFIDKMQERGFFAGLKLDSLFENFESRVLVSVTEKRTKAQMDGFVTSIKGIL